MNNQARLSERQAGAQCPTRAGKRSRVLCHGSILTLLLTTGCARETVFQSNFDANAVGQSPSHAQAIGTVNYDGSAGSVLVVAPPVTPSGKWVQISRPNNSLPVSVLQATLTQVPRDGTYVFTAFLFIPSGSGVATIQFEPFGQGLNTPSGFLHLDFMQDNRVRIDDDASTIFGTFPRDQVFIVKVTLKIDASSPSAQIVLSGAEASGQADRNIIPAFRAMARQFGAVRIWMGFPWTGSFDTTNVVVTRKTQ